MDGSRARQVVTDKTALACLAVALAKPLPSALKGKFAWKQRPAAARVLSASDRLSAMTSGTLMGQVTGLSGIPSPNGLG